MVDFDVTNKSSLYVTTMKTINFQVDIPSIPSDNFENHDIIVFDLTSMQVATENFHYTELIEEPLRLRLNFVIPLEHVNEFIVLGARMSSVAVDKRGVVKKIV